MINIRYFGGKSKIAKDISGYINDIHMKGFNECSISEENKRLQSTSLNGSIIATHTHTHTIC